MEPSEPRYANTADGTHIAYSVMGDGPIDLVYAFGYKSNIDADGEVSFHAAFRRRLASFARLILFDRRCTGLSDRSGLEDASALEAGMDDIDAGDGRGRERTGAVVRSGRWRNGVSALRSIASRSDAGARSVEPGTSPDSVGGLPVGVDERRMGLEREGIEARWGSLDFARDELRSVAPGVAFDRTTIEHVDIAPSGMAGY